ncbi:MAG: hypothetical protein AAGJ35_01455 [Myxococcota bacterium]
MDRTSLFWKPLLITLCFGCLLLRWSCTPLAHCFVDTDCLSHQTCQESFCRLTHFEHFANLDPPLNTERRNEPLPDDKPSEYSVPPREDSPQEDNAPSKDNEPPQGSKIGAPCSSDAACGENEKCIKEIPLAPPLHPQTPLLRMTGPPGGYCARDCKQQSCPKDSTCLRKNGQAHCVQTCNSVQNCRNTQGYRCTALSGGTSACLPPACSRNKIVGNYQFYITKATAQSCTQNLLPVGTQRSARVSVPVPGIFILTFETQLKRNGNSFSEALSGKRSANQTINFKHSDCWPEEPCAKPFSVRIINNCILRVIGAITINEFDKQSCTWKYEGYFIR